MGEYQRKRLNIACDVCRGRRTKCDGQRPKCGFCQLQGSHCVYQAAPQPPPSRLELDIAGMRERLEDIMGLLVSDHRWGKDTRSLSLPAASTTASLHASFQSSPRALSDHEVKYEPDDSEFPIMVLQRRSTMILLSLDPDMGVWLSSMERSTGFLSRRDQAVSPRVFLLPPESISSTLHAFSERIHVWLPILSSDFQESFHHCINGQSTSPSDTCLAMLVMALGLFAAADTITSALDQQLGAEYFAEASKLLPEVLLDFNVRSLQCLIFFSVYYMHLIRPCQAHDHILMASARAQNMLKIHSQGSDTTTVEALRRAYWAILLIESELSIQLDLPDSGIWKHEEEVQLPSPNGIWHLSLPGDSTMSPPSSQAFEFSSDTTPVYFLAEIAMRRMLRRCTTSLSKSAEGEFRYAPVIARELELQLDGWHKYLPTSLVFHKQPTGLYEVAEGPRAQFLQAQFFACKASISWPAVYQTITLGFVDDNMLPYCTKFFDDYVSFVLAATTSMQTCMMNTWTLAAR
ncbi:uncharacterized protein NECHADRAFT_85272 [Fusarium vanettenii 77-13-4]|uniref:Zn(2)-C6 fungal-type domain-containing protein n=1 Tax=Fusarium vanettenii (strain ATCC MYA-4622 / CBS 123669 / FGSC 9596 / NRRL 45880 / 77-13-4) TaxID=660122 RepID=C7YVG9_FUSV7|nr:uncharacterized protein NECHADRAFT_85272 [Fusarium vanettenii 77-13-4]EEU44586.1 hypothetical protein NECHADRAFT_85272 [Fusarium vanettenii 77-13-4]